MPAALFGRLRPQLNRFRLGSFEITTILDGAVDMDSISPPFGIDRPPEEVAASAQANLLPRDRLENSFAPNLVNTGEQLVLFDVGLGQLGRERGAGQARQLLSAAGYRPEDVDIVALTHVHPDHIGGLYEADQLAFPNARYVIGRVEFDAWKDGATIPSQRQDNRNLFLKYVVPLADNMIFLEPGDNIVPGIEAVEAYGHSAGHMAYHIESDGQAVLLWGDVTNHFVLSLQHPEWQVAYDDEPERAIATRLRMLEMTATDRLLVLGHHMPFPSVGYVEKLNGIYRWTPAAYQVGG